MHSKTAKGDNTRYLQWLKLLKETGRFPEELIIALKAVLLTCVKVGGGGFVRIHKQSYNVPDELLLEALWANCRPFLHRPPTVVLLRDPRADPPCVKFYFEASPGLELDRLRGQLCGEIGLSLCALPASRSSFEGASAS